MNVTHYDLFAGIGGFSYALDTIFHDHSIQHIFCEWEAFPTAVLKQHWPNAQYYGDIADLVADTARKRWERQRGQGTGQYGLSGRDVLHQDQALAIVTGGFPCQPFSQAGRRQGTGDDRYKWPDMFGVIQNVRPDWVVAENVRGLATWNEGMVLETVCVDMESEGYEVQPLIIPACAIDAPHRRDRVWIIAHDARTPSTYGKTPPSAITNPRPQCGQSRNGEALATHTGKRTISPVSHQRSGEPDWNRDWREVAFATCHDGVDDGLPRRMDGVTISAARHRRERIKACGNAIVPQVAMELFRAIRHSVL